MAIIDTSFSIKISDFSEIPEKEEKEEPFNLYLETLVDDVEPEYLTGCCGTPTCGGGCCGCC